MIKYARALGMKISVVLYDDGDRNNERGPIHSEIFKVCWEKLGKPADFWTLEAKASAETATSDELPNFSIRNRWFKPVMEGTVQAGGSNG